LAKILVVDDDPETRLLLDSILGDANGHEIVFATDGDKGISTFDKDQPDLVITDLVMPHLHGVLMIEHLTAVYPSTKIIAISGKAPEQLERAESAGAVASLQKPIDRDALVEVVEWALAAPKPWDNVRQPPPLRRDPE